MSLKNHRVVLIFVDGIGIGRNNPDFNPCTAPALNLLNNVVEDNYPRPLLFNGIAVPLDATLGVPGIPQSATGQTALLTGENASKILGYHFPGFPNEELRKLIYQKSLLKKINEHGKSAAFINAYPPIYFELGPEILKHRLSVTSHATLAGGFPFFNIDDVRNERAIYQEFTNRALIAKGLDLPVFTPEKAGEILARTSQRFDFSLFEYFQTDHVGHSQNMEKARRELIKLERFLISFLSHTDLARTAVIFTSDHGNIEDLSVRAHTYNSAMTLLWGIYANELATQVKSICQIAEKIYQILNIQ